MKQHHVEVVCGSTAPGHCCLLMRFLLCRAVHLAASLEAKHAGVGLSVFQSISTIVGGFAGPYLFGTVLTQQQDFTQATVLMGCFLGSSGLLATGLGAAEQWQHCCSSTAPRTRHCRWCIV
jgi:hypothetical protein